MRDRHSMRVGRSSVLALLLAVSLLVCACTEGPSEDVGAGDGVGTAALGSAPRPMYHRRSAVANRVAIEGVSAAVTEAAPCPSLDGTKIYRFIQGIDSCAVDLDQQQQAAELNDAWGATVLRKGVFPHSVDAIVAAINAANPTLTQNSYVVGEGSQIPNSARVDRDANRDLRYVVTWSSSSDGLAVLLSALPGGDSPFLQVIGWDPNKNRFNFYQFNDPSGGPTPAWNWTGDSSYARNPKTIGIGCFDCHHNGVTIMKEFKKPWNNWNSPLALIQPAVVPANVASEALFQNRQNAPQLENAIQGAVQRYYLAWLKERVQGTQITDVPEILRHLIVNTTVQLASTLINSDGNKTSPKNHSITGLPKDFFLWDSVLANVLSLNYSFPSTLQLDRAAYDQYLSDKAFKLVNIAEDGPPAYDQPGSTNFAFFVPTPPQEDVFMVQLMLQAKVVTEKFVASVLMVDFPNPVFSTARQSLQKYAEPLSTGTTTGGNNDVPQQFAAKVSAAAAGQPTCNPAQLDQCTAEQQFLHYWNLPDAQWQSEVGKILSDYMNAIAGQVSAGNALDAYMSLSASRRRQFATTPIISNLCEFSLLLPRTSLPAATLRMTVDATVVPGTPGPQAPASCLASSS